MTSASSAELPCGTQVEDLLAQVADGRAEERSEHQATCAHCQALLAELDRLWAPMRRLAEERVTVPRGLVAAVMYQVRRLVGTAWLGVRGGAGGATRITYWAVAKLASLAARQVPGVHQVLSRFAVAGSGADAASGDHAEMGADRVVIELDLVTEYGENLLEVSETVRRAVAAHVTALTGIEVTEVDITIQDVAAEPPDRDRRSD